MKLSLCIQTPEVPVTVPVALLSGSFDEKLEKAARLGVDGVELLTADPARLDPAALRNSLQVCNLPVAAVASGAVAFSAGLTLLHSDPAQAEQARARLYALIDLAHALQAPLVTVGSFRGRLAGAAPDGRQHLADLLCQAADYAAPRGVRLVIEPLNRYETDLIHNSTEGLAFLEQAQHPGLGLLLDTYHVNIEESSWTAPFRQGMVSGKLWHVHIGDNNRLPPGCGLIDFKAILAALHQAGYPGYLSAELLARSDPDQAARLSVEFLKNILPG